MDALSFSHALVFHFTNPALAGHVSNDLRAVMPEGARVYHGSGDEFQGKEAGPVHCGAVVVLARHEQAEEVARAAGAVLFADSMTCKPD